MIPRLDRLFVAHKTKATIQMQEHMELAALVDKLEALVEADAKQQLTHRWTDAINAKGRWGQWENIDIVLLDGIAKPTERLDGWQPASLISQIQSSSCPPGCFDQLQSNERKKGCTEMTAENRPYDWASETPARQKANRHTKTPYLGGRKRCRHSPQPRSQPPHRDPSTSKRNGRKVVSSIGTIAIILLAATVTLSLLGPTALNFLYCLVSQTLSVEQEQKDTQKYIYINIDINIDEKYRKTTGKEFQENSSVANLSGTSAYQTEPDLMTYSFYADKAAAEGSHAPEGCRDYTLSKVPDALLLDSELSVLARYGSKSPPAPARPRATPHAASRVRQNPIGIRKG